MEKLSCAIVGHSPQRFKFKHNEEAPLCRSIKSAITELIKAFYGEGVKLFYIGCAVGIDTWAAETIIELRQQPDFSDMELFCAIPFPEHSEKFTSRQKERYQNVLCQCTYQETVSRSYSPVAYKRLNYYMIDRAQYLIAVYDQDKSEARGLGQAVNYALKKNLHMSYIHPDTAVISHHIP